MASSVEGTDHRVDARRCLAFPVRTNEEVVAGLGGVGFADLGKLIGRRIVEGINPEAVAEIRYLDDHRLLIEGRKSPGRKRRPDSDK